MFMLSRLAQRLAAGALALAATAAMAQSDKPLRLIVPFAAGGGTDVWARLFASRLAARLGQQVVVENRAGASTQIGANAVAKAEADGNTLLFTSSTHIQVPALSPNLPYDVVRDFAPVAQLGVTGLMFVVNPALASNNMREFIAEAKANPKWSLGTYAAGSAGAVFSQYLVKLEGLQMPVAVYRGEAPAITDVVSGQIQGGFFSIPGVKAFVRSGRLKALGTLAMIRSPSLPTVPTLVEQGLARFDFQGAWIGLFAPARTPTAVVDRLAEASRAVLDDKSFQKEWADLDLVTAYRSPAEFRQDIPRDMEIWRELVQTLGIKAE